ncbi:hypothetical protein VP01_1556g3 [Puccinia sorghi]|uniref:Uncharacterized protein n=1 Tax=Puccinia sorghi TaxID=27349 RepID=A0A0L6VI46_9BASI|nr:hypothetical protein VP01_1556g3 [Puccinia sorghi]
MLRSRAVSILGALLNLCFLTLAHSSELRLVKRVYDPMAPQGQPTKPSLKTTAKTTTDMNIHCGNEFGSYKPGKGQMSCMDYASKKYNCDSTQCHTGQQTDTPVTKPRCHQLGASDGRTYLVYAYSYQARNLQGNLIATGFAVGDPTETVYEFSCAWKERLDHNNQRVWKPRACNIAHTILVIFDFYGKK